MEKDYSNFDFENLTEIYYKNPWLKHAANHVGFEVLWNDYKLKKQKKIIKKLINQFNYIEFEQAYIDIKKELISAIDEWQLMPNNTIFVSFKPHKYPDGSNVFSNFLKPIIYELNDEWSEGNFYSRLKYGIERIKAGGNSEFDINLKSVVLIDDFIGTGGTAVKVVNNIRKEIDKCPYDIKLFVFSLGAMDGGLRHLYKKTFIKYKNCYINKKGTELGFQRKDRKLTRHLIMNMELILSKKNGSLILEDYRLGYGKSEALYSLSRFNLPNNNYPILWWNRYWNNKWRKTIFNRMQ